MATLDMNGHPLDLPGAIDRALELQAEVERLRAALVEERARGNYHARGGRCLNNIPYTWGDATDNDDAHRAAAREELAAEGLLPRD